MTTFEITMALVAAVQTIAICVLYQMHASLKYATRERMDSLSMIIARNAGECADRRGVILERTCAAEKSIESLKCTRSLLLKQISKLSDAVNAIKKRRK